MNILQINNTDFQGTIYNGHDLQKTLNSMGINTDEIVLYKKLDDPRSVSFVSDMELNWQHECNQFEKNSGMLNMMEPFGSGIKNMKQFQDADIVHYQLIHNHVITVAEFGRMCKLKPSVWTIHDLWAFTGHCIHPLSCEKWKNGCENCEHLEDPFFELKYPKAHELWNLKKNVYKSINPDIIVASDFTLKHVKESPLMEHFTNIHKIPFGIKMEDQDHINVQDIKREWGIPKENIVISFRLNNSKLKGVKYLVKALERMKATNITVLVVDKGDSSILDTIRNKYQIIELGMQREDGMNKFYAVSDIFVMPSLAETFGLMAVEAMAHRCVVVVFEKTVLTEITNAPECGVNIPFKDYKNMAERLDQLVNSPDERKMRSDLGVELVKQKYRYDDYVKKHVELYEDIMKRNSKKEKQNFLFNREELMKEEKKMDRAVISEEKIKTTMFKELNQISNNRTNKIALFCAGNFAQRAYEILRRNGIAIDYVADNNEEKWGYWDHGLICVGKEQLKNEKENLLVIVANKNPDSIKKDLDENGFKYVIDFYKLEKIDQKILETYGQNMYDKIAKLDYSDAATVELVDYMNRKIDRISKYYEQKIDNLTHKVRNPKKVKAIAMYLPQFHETKENNEWWGQGYTEWTAVKKAKPLYDGHYQPHVPMNGNYYNLLERETMEWQSELAKEGNIFGFCFYHYWFKDGRKILEKPAENLLKWNNIDMKFCFSWANESWVRTWSNVKGGNSWVADDLNESKAGADERGVLLDQQYGTEKDWKEHFEYLLQFFKDPRYIKKDGKPVFMIYRPELVDCMDEMLAYWKELAIENGLPGIFIICANCKENKWQEVDARYIQEFNYSYSIESKPTGAAVSWDKGILTYDYDVLWENIIDRQYDLDEEVYLGACVNFDCTPRHGKKGNLSIGGTPEKFEHYFEELCKKSIRRNNEFVFINAWNEWGEGMHLEPDEKFGKAYLQAANKAITNANREYKKLSMEIDKKQQTTRQDIVISQNQYDYMCKREKKFVDYFNLFDHWFEMKEKGEKLDEKLKDKGYDKIAIYGMGKVGNHFIKELEKSDIEICYAIDRNGSGTEKNGIPVYSVDTKLKQVDAIIVTAVFDFENIERELKKVFQCPIISLSQIIYD